MLDPLFRWPGIITNDPMCMEYVVRDDDPICPEPTSYHVEFLGSTHSHCWVSAKIVQPYGLVDVTPKSAWTKTKSKAKVCFYNTVAQYPVRWAAQSALHFTPWQTCSFRHQLNFSGKHFSHAATTKVGIVID